ncbi:MAG: hypothetical protein OXH56_07840 [Gemmatimonadetes bacterium]|nr:hypothetical protein [Gemmatimonadota bacterium]
MEHAQLWLQPLILLTAFIFFWREAKGSRRELKEDIQKELNKIDARFNRFEDKIDARIERLEDRIREDMDKMDSRFDRLESALIEGRN